MPLVCSLCLALEAVSNTDELQKSQTKKRLYKDLYQGEKNSNEAMQQHYHEEMKVETEEYKNN